MKKTANLLKKGLTPETPMERAFPRRGARRATRATRAPAHRGALSTPTQTAKKYIFHAGFLHVQNFSPARRRRISGAPRA
jgi:hypothetical protein